MIEWVDGWTGWESRTEYEQGVKVGDERSGNDEEVSCEDEEEAFPAGQSGTVTS